MDLLSRAIKFVTEQKAGGPDELVMGSAMSDGTFSSMADGEEWNPDLKGINGLKTLDRMAASDPTVAAVIRAHTSPITSATWTVEPADDDAKSIDMADLVRKQLFGMEIEWQETVEEMLDFLTFGFYDFEQLWDISAGQAELTCLAPRPPLQLTDVLPDARGRFFGVTQTLQQLSLPSNLPSDVNRSQLTMEQAGDVFIPSQKLLHLVRRRRGGNFVGRSALRGAYKPWYIKKELEMLAGIAYEKRACGVDVMTLANVGEERVTPALRAKAEKVLRSMHVKEAQFVTEVPGMSYRLEGLRGGTLDPTSFIEYLDVSIARAAGAEFITMGSGTTGSFAQHSDKTSLFMQSLLATTRIIRTAVNRQVISNIVRYNFGDVPRSQYPSLHHSRLDNRDIESVATATATLANANLLGEITPDVQDAFRTMMELPQIEIDEKKKKEDGARGTVDVQKTALNGAQVTAAQGIVEGVALGNLPRGAGIGMLRQFFQMSEDDAELVMGDVGGSFSPPAAVVGPVVVEASHCSHGVESNVLPKSTFSPVECFDAEAVNAVLEDARESIVQDARETQAVEIKRLVEFATKQWAAGNKRALIKPKRPKTDDLAAAIAEHLCELSKTGRAQVQQETRLQSKTDMLAISAVDVSKQSAIDLYLVSRATVVSEKLADQLMSAYRLSVLPMSLSGEFDPVKLGASMTALQLRDVAAAARLSVSEALGLGRKSQQEQLERDGDVDHYFYSTATESETCPACAALEGARIEVGSEEFQRYYPPLRDGPSGPCEGGDGCNCDIIAVYAT